MSKTLSLTDEQYEILLELVTTAWGGVRENETSKDFLLYIIQQADEDKRTFADLPEWEQDMFRTAEHYNEAVINARAHIEVIRTLVTA
jgi:hypothetical protein